MKPATLSRRWGKGEKKKRNIANVGSPCSLGSRGQGRQGPLDQRQRWWCCCPRCRWCCCPRWWCRRGGQGGGRGRFVFTQPSDLYYVVAVAAAVASMGLWYTDCLLQRRRSRTRTWVSAFSTKSNLERLFSLYFGCMAMGVFTFNRS